MVVATGVSLLKTTPRQLSIAEIFSVSIFSNSFHLISISIYFFIINFSLLKIQHTFFFDYTIMKSQGQEKPTEVLLWYE